MYVPAAFPSPPKFTYKHKFIGKQPHKDANLNRQNINTNLLCEFLAHSVKSSMAVHDFRRSLLKPMHGWFGHILLLDVIAIAVRSGNDGHDEKSREELNCANELVIFKYDKVSQWHFLPRPDSLDWNCWNVFEALIVAFAIHFHGCTAAVPVYPLIYFLFLMMLINR